MKKLFAIVVAVVSVAVVCFCVLHSWSAATFNSKLAAAADRGSGTIALRRLVQQPWERVYIFDCYTAPTQVSHTLGFSYSDRNVEVIQSSEGHSLLLFVSGQHVVFSVLHPRCQGDFYPHSVGRSFTPEEAVFTAERRPEDARLLLSPPTNSLSPNHALQQTEAGGTPFVLVSSCLASLCR